MIWQATDENEPPEKPLSECRFKRIRLTVLPIDEDLEVLEPGPIFIVLAVGGEQRYIGMRMVTDFLTIQHGNTCKKNTTK